MLTRGHGGTSDAVLGGHPRNGIRPRERGYRLVTADPYENGPWNSTGHFHKSSHFKRLKERGAAQCRSP
jgi:hypothetical protein